MRLQDYLKKRAITRSCRNNFSGLNTIYNFMSESEKAVLKSHTGYSNTYDWRDCKAIKEKYVLTWNEVKYIVKWYA